MANVASYRTTLISSQANDLILPDLGFEWLPHIKSLFLTDLFDFLLLIPSLILILVSRTPLLILVKAFLTSTIANLLRITTVATTSLPDPRIGCQVVTENFFTNLRLHRCGDSVFSGHTVIYILCALIWISHGPKNKWGILGTFLISIGALLGAFFVLANRAHYTIDVLLAIYIVIGVWFSVSYFFEKYLVQAKRLQELTQPSHRVEELSLPTTMPRMASVAYFTSNTAYTEPRSAGFDFGEPSPTFDEKNN